MNFPLSCILVEDEALQMEILEREIKQYKDLQIVGKAKSLQVAYELVIQEAPQVAIMDVQFQGGTIYDLFNRLKEAQLEIPLTILVSAHDDQAVRALNQYNQEVAYFVLKREIDDYLRPAIDRMIGILRKRQEEEQVQTKKEKQHILIRSQGYMTRIPVEELCYAKVLPNGRSCLISEDNEIYEVNCTLKKLPDRYPALDLIRINKNEAILKPHVHRVNISDKEVEVRCGPHTLSFMIGPEYHRSLMDALKN